MFNLRTLQTTVKAFLLPLLVVVVFTACKGSDSGFAPSSTAPLSSNTQATLLKNGTAVQTANGWNLQVDTSDSINNTVTANGWKIEVKYE